MYNVVSAKVADELDGKEVSVKDFLASSWTDHVYLVPSDRDKRQCWAGILLTNTRDDSMKLLREKYINNNGMYIIREKDFGDNVISYWIYFGVIVSPEEYEAAAKEHFGKLFGGK